MILENFNEKFTKILEFGEYAETIFRLRRLGTNVENTDFKYRYLPSDNKLKKKCIHCSQELTIPSHSVSNNNLTFFAQREKIFFLKNGNLFHNLNLLTLINKTQQNVDKLRIFEKIAIKEASTYQGFCRVHDNDLFMNIDGNIPYEQMKKEKYYSLKYEILYRTLAWKIAKKEEDLEMFIYLNNLYQKEPDFKQLWDDIFLTALSKLDRSSSDYFTKQINTLHGNINNNKKFLTAIKTSRSIANDYFLLIDNIARPHFFGINFIHGDHPTVKIFMNKSNIKVPFFCGTLVNQKKYYSFILVSKYDKPYFERNNYFSNIIEPLLLLHEPENTFISESDKNYVANYILSKQIIY